MDDLFVNFRTAVTETTLIALTAASLIAVGISALISRRVIAPVRDKMHASRQIAQGNYGRRVTLPSNRPITELDEMGQLAHSFNQMAAQLEEFDTLCRQLIGDVTHELTTPLTMIKGSMKGLIVELGTLTNQVTARFRRQFEDKGVHLNVHVPPGLLMAEADPDRISQVLINLIGNGLQYMLTGGQVNVDVRRKNNVVLFTIADTGAGIAAEHLPYLFTRFYRVDKSRARAGGGSGIGLTIARHLVEAHGGQIWVESAGVGRGSQFLFFLPLAPGALLERD